MREESFVNNDESSRLESIIKKQTMLEKKKKRSGFMFDCFNVFGINEKR